MNKDVFTREEFLRTTGVSDASLAAWARAKLVRPTGFADDRTPLFTAEAVERAGHIRKLEDLGYGLDEIVKIVRKIGLPASPKGGKESGGKTPYLTVGSLAERSGVSPRTIKHWEDIGIIAPDMRTEGGFRLYSESYVFVSKLIRDLQLFGYTLEDIKVVSDEVRELLEIEAALEKFAPADVEAKLAATLGKIQALRGRMSLIKEGIGRWEDLVKKKKKEIDVLQNKNRKRPGGSRPVKKKGKSHA